MIRQKPHKLLVHLSVATLALMSTMDTKAQSLNCFDNLIFGEIMTCGTPGTVTVNPDNSTATSCVAANAPFSRARCIATQGFPFRPMQIQITSPTFTINSGANTMSVTDFNVIGNAVGPTTTITAPFVSIPIGATLNVGGTQPSGTYTGTLTISVNLQ